MRNTKQRETILHIVQESTDHPTADMVYLKVKDVIKNISLGTVYRNLNALNELGLIKKIKVSNGSERFDKTITTHSHFICDSCGMVLDIMDNKIENLIKSFESETGCKTEKKEISFVGKCSHCLEKN